MDFIVLETELIANACKQILVILGWPSLATVNALTNCQNGVMKLSFDDITLELNMFNIVKDLIEEYIQDEISTHSMEIYLVVHLNRVRN